MQWRLFIYIFICTYNGKDYNLCYNVEIRRKKDRKGNNSKRDRQNEKDRDTESYNVERGQRKEE